MVSHKFRIPGIILLLVATILSVFYFLFNFRFSFPVFAVVSSYAETRFFWSFSTNFADELILLLFTTGFLLTTFSREKNEYREFKLIRRKAVYMTILSNVGYIIFIILFTYGSAFISLVLFNIFVPFVFYLIFFNLMKFKVLRMKKWRNNSQSRR